MTSLRFTSHDLELLPERDDLRYEIIDGELHVSRPPNWYHQYTCNEISSELRNWNRKTGAGITLQAHGLVFAEDEDVVA